MKIKHLRKPAEFTETIRTGEKTRKRGLTVFFKQRPQPGGLSVGIIVSKKVEPKAVRRNYVRRIAYAICEEQAGSFTKETIVIIRLDTKISDLTRRKAYLSIRRGLEEALSLVSGKN